MHILPSLDNCDNAVSITSPELSKCELTARRMLDRYSDITEIEFNGYNSIYFKQAGQRKQLTTESFTDSKDYYDDVCKLIAKIHPESTKQFIAEGTLFFQDSVARVHITLPPVCLTPQITFARRSAGLKTLDDIASTRSLNADIIKFLVAATNAKCTMVISGGTGSGKTTMLEAISRCLSPEVRFGVCEDSAELKLSQENVVYLQSKVWSPGMDMNSVATLSWCVQQLNRMRVDRIVVGETRGKEFADFIIAANSGCEGSLTTIHSNTPRTALQKMANFITAAQQQPTRIINQSIANTVDIIVQLGLDNRGRNRVMEIQSIMPTLGQTDSAEIGLHPIFTYDPQRELFVKKSINDGLRTKLEAAGYDPNNNFIYDPKLVATNRALIQSVGQFGL